jgi:1-acyl-sn-glycerol-3-phosphate acyltransferase
MILLRSLVFNLAFFLWALVLGTLGLPLLLAPRQGAVVLGRVWSSGTVWLLRHVVGLEHQFRGLERVPRGACIVAIKHQSAWDAVILSLALDDPVPVVKRELLRLPIYGWYMGRAGAIAIDRRAGAAALRRMVEAARPAVVAGRPIVIFPQGTRVAPGARLPYQPGVAALYRALALPLVPAAVNSGLFWGRRSFIKRPGRIVLEFLDPIPAGWRRQELMAELERRIETATTALETEAAGAALGPPAKSRGVVSVAAEGSGLPPK